MSVNKENRQEALKAHVEWLAWKAWEIKDEETRGEEPPKGERFVCYADLSYANLSYADLSYADLIGANLSGAHLRGTNLSYANLSGANLSYADLIGADLSYADLIGTNLRRAHLRGANLSYANLIGADLSYAHLIGVNLSGAHLRGAVGNDIEIKSMQVDIYRFAWTDTTLAIGCQQHPLKDWLEFSDEKKASFAGNGLPYLNKWLPILDSMGVFDPVKETPLPEGEDHA